MKTPIEQVREALEYTGGVLTMHTGISTRSPTPDEYEHALKDVDTALTALKSLEGPRLTVDEYESIGIFLRLYAQLIGDESGDVMKLHNRVQDVTRLTKAAKP